MGYSLNNEAYGLFIQIEVGIREFLINLIKEKGVNEWVQSFLGNVQRDTLNEILIRVSEANKKQSTPNIKDQYIFKLDRALKTIDSSFKANTLYHPFYYLNWPDMDKLMGMRSNTALIDKRIGKLNREVIVGNLKSLNFLRNDIAHSRFISENDYKVIKGAFDQISALIPEFSTFANNQTHEEILGVLLRRMCEFLKLIVSSDMLKNNEIDEIIKVLEKCMNSFWLNSLDGDLIQKINRIQIEILKYKQFRNTPGGLLKIIDWKRENTEFLQNLIKDIEDGKI